MIPRASVTVFHEIPAEATYWMPPPDDVDGDEEADFFDDTLSLGAVSREQAVAVASAEHRLVAEVDRLACTDADYEKIATAIDKADPARLPTDFADRPRAGAILDAVGGGRGNDPILPFDLGVAGLCYAVASIGAIPVASCRWHLSEESWSKQPIVFMAATRSVVTWLQPLVAASGCGFDIDSLRPDLLAIEAPSITMTMELTELILNSVDTPPRVRY